jgi:hypothetical protein
MRVSDRDRDRTAVVAHLEDQLAVLLAWRSMTSRDETHRVAGSLADKADAAAALDVIDDAERGRWKHSASQLAARRPTGREAKRAQDLARSHLERLANELDRVVASARGRERAAAYRGAVLAYRTVGLITDQQALHWLNKLYVAHYRSQPRTRDGGGFHATGTPRLIAGPTRRIAGVRLTALAFYTDGILLTCHWDPTRARQQPPEAIPSYLGGDPYNPLDDATLHDDAGTRYRLHSATWQPVGYALRNITTGTAAFTPGLPTPATRLRLQVGTEKLSIKVN